MIDVVIPAWNEERALPFCLASALRNGRGLGLRIIVVANGCRDRTAEVAESFRREAEAAGHELVVLETDTPSKVSALNAATAMLRSLSVVYLDADVVLAPGSLAAMAGMLNSTAAPRLVAPALVPCRPRNRVVRSFSVVHGALPGMRVGVVGGGCYAVNRSGRTRWGDFPNLIGDDAFVRSLFAPEEQRVLGAGLLTRLPETLPELAGQVARWRRGNRELRGALPSGIARPPWLDRRNLAQWLGLITGVARFWPHLPGFLLASLAGRLQHAAPMWAPVDSARPPSSKALPSTLVRPQVHVIVVTYRSRDYVGECLDNLRSMSADLHVTVVDNASDDGTADEVSGTHPTVHLIRNGSNRGFGAAVNQVADRVGSDYLFLLNPDVRLDDGMLDHLLALALRVPEAGLYGGRAEAPDGGVDPSSCLARPGLRQYLSFGSGLMATGYPVLDPDSLGGWSRDDCRPVPVLTGAALLVDTGLWRRLGGFDERYFLYGEDVDLCIRAASLGAAPMFTPLARYWHSGGASSAPVQREIFILRGKATLADVHLPGVSAVLARQLLLIGVALRAAYPAPSERRAVWRGVWEQRASWQAGW